MVRALGTSVALLTGGGGGGNDFNSSPLKLLKFFFVTNLHTIEIGSQFVVTLHLKLRNDTKAEVCRLYARTYISSGVGIQFWIMPMPSHSLLYGAPSPLPPPLLSFCACAIVNELKYPAIHLPLISICNTLSHGSIRRYYFNRNELSSRQLVQSLFLVTAR